MSSLPLTNYLRSNRKRLALTQDEVAFLLGFRGVGNGAKVCRDEKFTREPKLRMVLAYEAIYQKTARDLFAGLYRQIEQEVAERAKILNFRKDPKPSLRATHKRQVLANLAARQSEQPANPPQT
jgi:transcriptional regulator with XRE-family HTH domain